MRWRTRSPRALLRRSSTTAQASTTATILAGGAEDFRWRLAHFNRSAPFQTFQQLLHRRSLGALANLLQQVVRQRRASHCRPGFQLAMKLVRHVSKLNHLRHVENIVACASHVNMRTATPKGKWTALVISPEAADSKA